MKSRNLTVPVVIISVAIPLVVALLFFLPGPDIQVGFDIRILPLINAVLNSITAVLLLASLYFILHKQRKAHELCNLTAVGLSVLFLLSYVVYHALSEQAHYGGQGVWRTVYFSILISHILLSAIIVPLVLVTLIRALKGNFARHRKIARYTWPLWLYVALSGVTVYIMMAPYY
jgi:putative membrane protein